MNEQERRAAAREFLDTVDWDTYDYTKAPGADMRFPDFTAEQVATNDLWLGKHYNKVNQWKTVHVPNLNEIAEGKERRLMALYGVPVEWPTKDENEDELNDLIDEMDSARERGGDEWKESMSDHGIVNDEHYLWMRCRALGYPDQLQDYDKARKAIVEIDQAISADDSAEDLMRDYGFRDPMHFNWFKGRINDAKEKAWASHNAILKETFKMLDERFEKNKEALKDELAPYKGVSMEDWAGANAKLIQGGTLEQVLQVLRIERPVWDEVNAEWNARMSRDTTATIATVYGQAFTGAGAGQFGAAAQAMSSSMQAGFGNDVKASDPISFEQWIKIQAHISAGSAQGKDVASILSEYKMNAADWGTVGGYWSLKMNSNPMEYLEKFSVLTAKYTEAFATGKAGADIEF